MNTEINTGANMPDEVNKLKEHSIAEFFKKNRQMLGLYGKLRSLTTIIHEYVANSIDACEEAGILPEIEVKIVKLGEEHFEVHVIDNGPGIDEKNLGKALGKLLAGTKFHRLIQMRGQQGIGASGCILFSQMTCGKPTKVISGNSGKPVYMEIGINVEKNEPIVTSKKYLDKEFKGLAISSEFKEIDYQDSSQNALEYLKRTAIANPHVTIKFLDPFDKLYVFERSINTIPPKPTEISMHIKCVDTDTLVNGAKNSDAKTVTGYLKENYDRVGDKFFDDLQQSLGKDLNLKDMRKKDLDWSTAEKIIKAIQKTKTIAPRTDALIPISEESLTASIKNILKPETLYTLTRKPTAYKGGYPFQVEVAISYGGNSGRVLKDGSIKSEIMRFANRTPLLFDPGSCAITNAINSIDWKRYHIKDFDNEPITVIVSLSSVHIPYTNAGKQAVAEENEIIDEIKLALMTAARAISNHISRKMKHGMKLERKKMFERYSYELAYALEILTGEKAKDITPKLEEIILKRLELEDEEEQENTDYSKCSLEDKKTKDELEEDIIDNNDDNKTSQKGKIGKTKTLKEFMDD